MVLKFAHPLFEIRRCTVTRSIPMVGRRDIVANIKYIVAEEAD